MTVCIAAFQQLTGINAIMFYCGVLFHSLGTSRSTALLNTTIVGAVNVVATFVSMYCADRFGRRSLFIEGGVQMGAALTTIGIVLGVSFSTYGTALPSGTAIGTLIVICGFVAASDWSWGPLGWLVPSEIQTLETCARGWPPPSSSTSPSPSWWARPSWAPCVPSASACSSDLQPGWS